LSDSDDNIENPNSTIKSNSVTGRNKKCSYKKRARFSFTLSTLFDKIPKKTANESPKSNTNPISVTALTNTNTSNISTYLNSQHQISEPIGIIVCNPGDRTITHPATPNELQLLRNTRSPHHTSLPRRNDYQHGVSTNSRNTNSTIHAMARGGDRRSLIQLHLARNLVQNPIYKKRAKRHTSSIIQWMIHCIENNDTPDTLNIFDFLHSIGITDMYFYQGNPFPYHELGYLTCMYLKEVLNNIPIIRNRIPGRNYSTWLNDLNRNEKKSSS